MKIIIFVILLLVIGVITPKIFIRSSALINPAKGKCGIQGARMLLSNPFERLLIMNLSAKEQKNDDVFVFAYTFFGLKYAEVEADCASIDETGYGGSAKVLRRGLFL